jgi:hypothetical protein
VRSDQVQPAVSLPVSLDVNDRSRLFVREVAVVGDDRRIQFPADGSDQSVHPCEERSPWPDLVCDLPREHSRVLACLVDLAPREVGPRSGNVTVPDVSLSDEDFGVRRRREYEPFVLAGEQVLDGGVDIVQVVDEERRIE